MTVLAISAVGIGAVILALQLKTAKGEYAVCLILAAQLLFLFYSSQKLQNIMEGIRQMADSLPVSPVYLEALIKMAGLTYIAEFSAGICKDSGYGSLGEQIRIFGKLSVLALGVPIMLALFHTMEGVLA